MRPRDAGPLLGKRVQPIEGLADFCGTETGLDQAILKRVTVTDQVRVFAEVMFKQVQQYIENALFHCPRPASRDAVEVKKLRIAGIATVLGDHVSLQFHDEQHGGQRGGRQSGALHQ